MALEWWQGRTETNTLDYRIEDYKLRVYEQAPENVKNIIKTTQNWGIHFHWTSVGPVAEWLGAHFHLRAYLENMGPNLPEYQFPANDPLIVDTEAEPLNNGVRFFERDIDVPAGSVEPGIYKLTCVIQVYDDNKNEPVPVAGFCEGPLIEFYVPKH